MPFRIGMRWWLAGAFALIAAVPVPDPRRMHERKAERRRVTHALAESV
jgi:hypothetical protein